MLKNLSILVLNLSLMEAHYIVYRTAISFFFQNIFGNQIMNNSIGRIVRAIADDPHFFGREISLKSVQ
jgi:hypothetical protein